jgi:hypothetical protein
MRISQVKRNFEEEKCRRAASAMARLQASVPAVAEAARAQLSDRFFASWPPFALRKN